MKTAPQLMANLNAEQKKAIMKLFLNNNNFFITGGAGVGKSFLLKTYLTMNKLRQTQTQKNIAVCAYTGVAALSIGGTTIHRLLGRDKSQLPSLDELIIDEISMCPAELLEKLDSTLRGLKNHNLPFGGVRVIVIGDFFQLPPVGGSWCFTSPLWRDAKFQCIYLRQQMRCDDSDFYKILNDVRVGDLRSIRQSANLKTTKQYNKRLFSNNRDAAQYNQSKLDAINSPAFTYFRIDGEPHFSGEYNIIPPQITLKIGAEVMFVWNDPRDQFVNGTCGKVVRCETDYIIVKIDDGRLLSITREAIPIFDALTNIVGYIYALPLVLAWGTTIHKSQGLTLQNADIQINFSPHGLFYVALSRFRRSSDFTISYEAEYEPYLDPLVTEFYKNLLSNATVSLGVANEK